VAVAAQTEADPGKPLAQMADHPFHQGQDLAAARCRCLPQHGQDQPAAGVEDMNRQKAPVIVIGIELAQFLLAMDPIKAFIKIKGQMAGDDRKAVAIQVEHRHAIEFRAPRHVLQAGDGRLWAERRPRNRRSVQRHLEDGVVPEHVAVVAVRIAGRNRQHAKPQDLIEPMGNLPRLPGIMQASCQPGRKVQPAFDILEQQEAAIGRRAPVVDQGWNRLVTNRWQAG
jgi:hypothetical protein